MKTFWKNTILIFVAFRKASKGRFTYLSTPSQRAKTSNKLFDVSPDTSTILIASEIYFTMTISAVWAVRIELPF